MQTNIIGIDPGLHGGIAILVFDGDPNIPIHIHDMPDTYPDMFNLLSDIKAMFWPVSCVLEDVGNGIPGQSSKATATFARHNGHLEMALYALGIPTEKVTPAKWMKHYSNQVGTSKGLSKTEWKNKLKGLAQRLYPSVKVTLNTADAILIANYGKTLSI